MSDFAETDLMICETDSKGRDNPQLQRIMQVIMKDDAWRKKLTEKTLAFEKYYPVMVRSGFILYDGYTTRISDFDV